ncbi:MAG: hypothetical protein OER86_07770 [Phycisphaerae bacterium]|nr:hypothetical protein [Phycisphaerae bacterium]
MSEDSLPRLCDADADAIDALMDHGLDPTAVPGKLRPRAQGLSRLLGLLDDLPEERADDLLIARTLKKVADSRRAAQFSRHIDDLAPAGRIGAGLPLRQVAGAAAIVLLSVSLLWPMLAHHRYVARQLGCQANLASAALGLSGYANDHRGAMPATAARLGDPWVHVNRFVSDGETRQRYAQSNSAHLFVAVRLGYVDITDLQCVERPAAVASLDQGMLDWPEDKPCHFSYQNQYTLERPRFSGGTIIAVLADKNPVFEPGAGDRRDHAELSREANSWNHGYRGGQNVLTNAGHVLWLTTPVLPNGDNIFHAGNTGFDFYTGLEAPQDEHDSFLVP